MSAPLPTTAGRAAGCQRGGRKGQFTACQTHEDPPADRGLGQFAAAWAPVGQADQHHPQKRAGAAQPRGGQVLQGRARGQFIVDQDQFGGRACCRAGIVDQMGGRVRMRFVKAQQQRKWRVVARGVLKRAGLVCPLWGFGFPSSHARNTPSPSAVAVSASPMKCGACNSGRAAASVRRCGPPLPAQSGCACPAPGSRTEIRVWGCGARRRSAGSPAARWPFLASASACHSAR